MPRKQITTATTTVVRAGSGRLKRISLGGGTMGSITAYDHASAASGEVIWKKTTPVDGETYEIMMPVTLGIVIVTAAATVVNAEHDRN